MQERSVALDVRVSDDPEVIRKSWENFSKTYVPGKLSEDEKRQLERMRFEEEQSRKANFCLCEHYTPRGCTNHNCEFYKKRAGTL